MDMMHADSLIEFKHILESLLASSGKIETWTSKNCKSFIKLAEDLGVKELEFNVVSKAPSEEETEKEFRKFLNWRLMKEKKRSCSVYSKGGLVYKNSHCFLDETFDSSPGYDASNKHWSDRMFFFELKHAVDEALKPETRSLYFLYFMLPEKSKFPSLQTPLMDLVKQVLNIED